MSVTMFVISEKMQSDSDSEPEYLDSDELRQRVNSIYGGERPVVTINPSEKIYDRWNNIPLQVKKEAGQLMKVCTFWYPILLQRQETNNTTRWAVQVGFIDSNHKNDLTVKRLYKIETLESILTALEKGCYNMDQTRHALFISNKFNLNAPEVLEDALRWLERADEDLVKRVQELGHKQLCFAILQHLFTEYAQYVLAMGENKEVTMVSLKATPNKWAVEKSDAMRIKGNEHFMEKNYESAVKCYSKAIRYHPENHIIYGNRALCYIRCEKYLKAVGDGKRATLIMPLWAKGHYRYSEALFSLGEIKRAIEANSNAQLLCKDDREGIKDLGEQQLKFLSELDVDIKDIKAVEGSTTPTNGMGSLDNTDPCVMAPVPTEPKKHSKPLDPVHNGQVDKWTRPETDPRIIGPVRTEPRKQSKLNGPAVFGKKLKELKKADPELELMVTHKPPSDDNPGGQSFTVGLVMKNPDYKPDKNSRRNKDYRSINSGGSTTTFTGATTYTNAEGRTYTKIDLKQLTEATNKSSAQKVIKRPECPEHPTLFTPERIPTLFTPERIPTLFTPERIRSSPKVEAPDPVRSAPEQKAPELKVPEQKAPEQKVSEQKAPEQKAEAADKKSHAEESPVAAKKKERRNKSSHSKDTVVENTKPDMREALRSAVQDAHTALTNLCSRNAEQAFSVALALVEANTPKELGMSTLDIVLLLYGRASALTEIGQVQELAEAQRQYGKIKSYEERTFQCFVYYGIGKVYLKENRYPEAHSQFSDSLQMVKNQITPGKLTWPMTKEVVKETNLDYFKELLARAMELCKFPPNPDAICCHETCLGHLKVEIYFTDPDFKGFIRIGCCQNCIVEYHMNCWKTLKAAAFSDRNDKDFLQEPCFTPDCEGRISSIHIYGSTGLIKCKFETVISKPDGPKKLKVNQTCSSLKKLKSKEERKLKRKQHRQASDEDDQSEKSENDHIPLENAVGQSLEKASSQTWLLYRDRVLLQISERLQSFKQEKCQRDRVTDLWSSLKPWVELDQSKGNALAVSLLGGSHQEPQTLDQVAELLLERKNRVWARVFVHFLCSCVEISPKLHDWASQLDSAGLDAAKEFLERYSVVLEDLDKTVLFTFVPMNAVLRRNAKVVSDSTVAGLTGLTEQDQRLLIWTLEEHRHEFVHLHTILDEYFEMMDGHCLVIKKTENENEHNSPIKAKNKSRKKKKETKPVIIISGMRGGTLREEREQDFLDEDDSLLFLNQNDPFSVPNHLREQVADFEEQYSAAGSRSRYKNILDNNPDPTKESLYDYFAQILEEHGPLDAEDPLLVGEVDYFPPVAQQKIQQAGGLKPFLLESLRFITMGLNIGLAKHAVTLQHSGAAHGALVDGLGGLDDLDVIGNYSMDPSSSDFLSLPSPFLYDAVLPLVASGGDGAVGSELASSYCVAETLDDPHLFSACDLDHDLDLYVSQMDGDGAISEGPFPIGEKLARKQSVVQVKRAVAVNTEKLEPFEVVNNGEITKREKSQRDLEKHIYTMKHNHDQVNAQRREVITALQEEYAEITTNTQVMNKELVLFQQKLEDEVKRDQREKRENQEALKALKLEIKALAERQESISKSIREKNLGYDRQLERFLELSNQSAAEKMSLEDEIRRCKELCAKTVRRSQAAQLSNLENQRDQGLHDLKRSRSDANAILAKLEEVAPRFPPQALNLPRGHWRACVKESEDKISNVEAQYQVQMEQVKNGSRLGSLPSIIVPSAPQTPVVPMFLSVHQLPQNPPSSPSSHDGAQATQGPPHNHQAPMPNHQAPMPNHQAPMPNHQAPMPNHQAPMPNHQAPPHNHQAPPHNHQPPTHSRPEGAASPLGDQWIHGAHAKPHAKPMEQQPMTVFERVLEHLSSVFPVYTRLDLMKFVQEFRVMNGRQLNNMAFQDVASGVTQIILDHQEQVNNGASSNSNRSTPQRSGTPVSVSSPLPVPVWQTLGANNRPSHALNVDDPCIICHDDMFPGDAFVLECRHSFHKECIKLWLREQSTCPTCRVHTVLPEDFPMLPAAGRMMRRDPHPSANLS